MKSLDPKAQLQRRALELLSSKRPAFVQAAMRVVRCRCLAEDIVQDAVVKICENGVDAGVRQLPSYLYRVVHNLAIDCARRRSREFKVMGPEDGAEHVASPRACPDAALEHCEALRAVLRAMADLPDRTRHAFETHRIDGVPQREIAAALHVSPTLVNFMIRDAHLHCAQRFASYEAGEPLPCAPQKAKPKARPKRSAARRAPSGAVRLPAAPAAEPPSLR
ncbi:MULTISPECIES: sigma-70 family RNA polymerase sigma factor [Rhodomicrobium]|uniref:sigma-70 family RNA polymerase sigma factor n=1 Tax=Rhodomicrobium TaxID=1068 RepID=UPI000B4C115B|nr:MULTISPECIES: sigma-70 family RNA polymerase sigma factor [Rhodomicrobium]